MTTVTPPIDLASAFQQTFIDLIRILPYALLSVIIVAITVLIIRLLNKGLKTLTKLLKLDEIVERIIPGGLKPSPSTLVVVLTDLAIVIIALILVARLYMPFEPVFAEQIAEYIARFGSVVVILILFMAALNAATRLISTEKKIESMIFLLLFFLGVSMVVDLTGLSPDIKSALSLGISIGIGLSLGVFTAWFLFGDYLESKYRREIEGRR